MQETPRGQVVCNGAWPRRSRFVRAILFVLLLLAVASCGTEERAPAQPAGEVTAPTHRVAFEAAYYLEGPQQDRPPDGMLAPGTTVWRLKEAGSYDLVRTQEDVVAWVAAAALEPLEAVPPAGGDR
jgi:hypothetical protein